MKESVNKKSIVVDKIKTQQFLDNVYVLVAANLQDMMKRLVDASDEEMNILRKLAEEIRIPISDSYIIASERENIVNRVTWLPVAQECVVALLRAILGKSRHGKITLHPEHLRQIANEISDHHKFSRNLGLSPEDAKLALVQTTETIMKHDLFSQPTKLAVDDNTYLVRREDDHLVVEPAA